MKQYALKKILLVPGEVTAESPEWRTIPECQVTLNSNENTTSIRDLNVYPIVSHCLLVGQHNFQVCENPGYRNRRFNIILQSNPPLPPLQRLSLNPHHRRISRSNRYYPPTYLRPHQTSRRRPRSMSPGPIHHRPREMHLHRSTDSETPRSSRYGSRGRTSSPYPR